MILNKKGMDLSLNFLIIAALAIIALIVIALFFTGGITKLFQKEADIVQASQQELALAKANCAFWCEFGNKESFENPPFSEGVRNAGFTKCTDFDYTSWVEDCESSCKPKPGISQPVCVTLTNKESCIANDDCQWG